jgi:AMMECR1 domain-containing protein
VSQLSCSVSLLRCFEEAASWHDWEIGQHGLIIEFTDPVLSCKRTATFLPEVAGDQGWSQQQCIEALIRKAGECRAQTMKLWQWQHERQKIDSSASSCWCEVMCCSSSKVKQTLQ